MANTYNNTVANNIGPIDVDVYTCPALTTAVVMGFTLANILGSGTTVECKMWNVGTASFAYIVAPETPIQVGSSLVAAGAELNIILTAGDKLTVKAEHDNAVDAVISVMEIT